MALNDTSEQLEEGEIIDDDLEDISDNPIIESSFGKLVTSNGHLRAVSLSSDSGSDRNKTIKRKYKRHRTRHIKRRRRSSQHISWSSSNSDSPTRVDLKSKLKEALCHEVQDGKKNDLETKLKGMKGLEHKIELDDISPGPIPDSDPKPLLEPPKSDKLDNSDKIDDVELENLRLEALKTAVLNRFQNRKKKKALENENKSEMVVVDNNKENENLPVIEESRNENKPYLKPNNTVEKTNNTVEKTNNSVTDLEEDEDILRASLLAGLAKKIIKTQPPISDKPQGVVASKPQTVIKTKLVKNTNVKIIRKPIPRINPLQIPKKLSVKGISRKLINNKLVKNNTVKPQPVPKSQFVSKPQVKPLIINLNNDSDSDDDPPETVQKSDSKTQDFSVKLDHLLKNQWNEIQIKKKSTPEKPEMKLLPKSKQDEYRLLKQRIHLAERKQKLLTMRLQPPLVRVAVAKPSKPETTTNEMGVTENKPTRTLPENQEEIEQKEVTIQPEVKCETEDSSESDELNFDKKIHRLMEEVESIKKNTEVIKELKLLQRTIKEIRTESSLQMKRKEGKYRTLAPIIEKIKEASNERKKQDKLIRNLLDQLTEAKDNFSKSYSKLSSYIRDLVKEKELIDKSCNNSGIVANGKINTDVAKKNEINLNKGNTKQIEESSKNLFPVTSTPIKEQSETVITERLSESVITNHDCEDMDVCNSDDPDNYQIDIADPNDIDQIFTRRKPIIPEYISPLNNFPRYKNVDPHGIMCPYDLNGSCRDASCSYKHYLRNF